MQSSANLRQHNSPQITAGRVSSFPLRFCGLSANVAQRCRTDVSSQITRSIAKVHVLAAGEEGVIAGKLLLPNNCPCGFRWCTFLPTVRKLRPTSFSHSAETHTLHASAAQ